MASSTSEAISDELIANLTSKMREVELRLQDMEEGSEDWIVYAAHLVEQYKYRYLALREEGDLDEAIRRAGHLLSKCDAPPIQTLEITSDLYAYRYMNKKVTQDIRFSILLTIMAVPESKLLGARLRELAKAIHAEVQNRMVSECSDNDLDLLDEGLKVGKIADNDRIAVSWYLGLLLCANFRLQMRESDIQRGIKFIESAMALPGGEATTLPDLHIELGKAVTLRYSITRNSNDIDLACKHFDNGLKAQPQRDDNLARRMNFKVEALQARYMHEGRKGDLIRAYDIACEALEIVEPESPGYPMLANNVGSLAQNRYNEHEGMEYLELTLLFTAKAVSAINNINDPNVQAAIYETRSHALLSKYQATMNTAFLDQAEEGVASAKELLPSDNVKAADFTFMESIILHERAFASGSQSLLERAIEQAETASEEAGMSSFYRPLIHFKLCSMKLALYRSLPEPKIIAKAIAHGERCLAVRAPDSPRRFEALNCLSNAYFARFEVERGKADLDKAIEIGLLSVARDEALSQPEYLANLASKFRSRAVRYEAADDIKQSVAFITRAANLRFQSHRIEAFVLGNQALILLDSYRITNHLPDLTASVEASERAMEHAKEGDGSLSDIMHNLGNAYFERYKRESVPEDWQKAVKFGRKAIASCPKSYYHRAMMLDRLAVWLAEGKEESKYSEEAKRLFQEALDDTNASPTVRIAAGRNAVDEHLKDGRYEEALRCLKTIVDLYPLVSPRGFTREEQQFGLARLAGLAAVAGSCALSAGRTDGEALELLESGRGIMSSWRLFPWKQISELDSTAPKLAQDYVQLRKSLVESPKDHPPCSYTSHYSSHFSLSLDSAVQMDHREIYRNKAREILDLEHEIRKILPNFSLPPNKQEMIEMSKEGPIVEINVTRLRSDAFLVTGSGITSIPLPKFGYTVLVQQLDSIFGKNRVTVGTSVTRHERNLKMKAFLGWLWDSAVREILAELEFLDTAVNKPRRIFWVTNGLAGLCPFHAAGRYGKSSPDERCMDHAVSTYVTTFRALRSCRDKKTEGLQSALTKPLMIAMDKTVGEDDLSASEEADIVKQKLEGTLLRGIDVLHHPSKADVLKALEGRDIVHFACHGYADSNDPSRSRFLLHDSENAGKPDQLNLYDLSATDKHDALIAYLSACSTAETASVELIDESIHLAAGFQLSGFTHVIGTLWSLNNAGAVRAAGSFYSSLVRYINKHAESGNKKNHEVIAMAAHDAVRALRDTKMPGSRKNPIDDFLTWATLIHFGA